MTSALMQPYFFPYLGYFQLINAVDIFGIGDDVQFSKESWINRNRILIQNEIQYITFPVEKASHKSLICDRKYIDERLKILNKIKHAYQKAPFFSTIWPLIEEILSFNDLNVSKFNVNQLKLISSYLDLNTKFLASQAFTIEKQNDREKNLILKVKKMGSYHYINAINGLSLYNKENFKNNGINLSFIRMNNVVYKQFTDQFEPNLSIIDVMMFNSKEAVIKMLNEYTLV